MEAAFSNAEKLAAVVEYWAAPRIKQLLPTCGEMLTSAVRPVVMNWAERIPDESIPATAAEIVKRAKEKGVVRFWRVELDKTDITELEILLQINLPYSEPARREYKVITPEESGE